MKAIHNYIVHISTYTNVVANLLKVKNESNSQRGITTFGSGFCCGKSTKSKE